MYKYNGKMKMKQVVFLIGMGGAAIVAPQVYFKGLFALFALLMVRDLYRTINTRIKVLPDKVQYFIGEKLDNEVLYKDLEFITYTRKNKNWIVLVTKDGKVNKLVKDIDGFDNLMKEILNYTKSNKKIEVHENILASYK